MALLNHHLSRHLTSLLARGINALHRVFQRLVIHAAAVDGLEPAVVDSLLDRDTFLGFGVQHLEEETSHP